MYDATAGPSLGIWYAVVASHGCSFALNTFVKKKLKLLDVTCWFGAQRIKLDDGTTMIIKELYCISILCLFFVHPVNM